MSPSSDSDEGPAPEDRASNLKANRRTRLAIGLGNPGQRYRGTRHNLGFEVVDRVAESLGLQWQDDSEGSFFRTKTRWQIAIHENSDGEMILLKPLTFMNLSGNALAGLARKREEEFEASECFVIVDDLSIPPGHLRLRGKGSDGGHNGLKSIKACLGTDRFPRLRIGIGSPAGDEDSEPRVSTADFVLQAPESEEELDLLGRAVARAAEAIIVWGSRASLEELMNRFNGRADAPSS